MKCYNLRIMYLNVWGLFSKYNKLLTMLCELEEKGNAPDIIFSCETFLVDMKVSEFREYDMEFLNRQNLKMVV